MENVRNFAGVQINPQTTLPAADDEPFRLLVMGDFSGRGWRHEQSVTSELTARKPLLVDRDNFDEVLAACGVRLDGLVVGPSEVTESIRFTELDDFDPERLFQRLPMFETLRSLRERLLHHSTFAAAAEEVRQWAQLPEPPPPSTAATAPPEATLELPRGGSLLDAVIGQSEGISLETAESIRWQAMIRQVAARYAVPGADPQQSQLVACVDRAVAQLLRGILAHPQWRRLEAAWRSLFLIVRRLETDHRLQIFVLDVSRAELTADLAGDDLTGSGLYRLLVDQTINTPGAPRWAAIVGDFTFNATAASVDLLARVGAVAAAAGAPWLAAADASVVGCTAPWIAPETEDWQPLEADAAARWQVLRTLPQAAYIALVWPRYLIRLPYGQATRPVASLDFEEASEPIVHEDLLWGNGAILLGFLLGESFTHSGWDMQPGDVNTIGDLPWLVAQVDGQPHAFPCGEMLLREQGMRKALEQGLVPLVSALGQPAVQLANVRSLAGSPLEGRWR